MLVHTVSFLTHTSPKVFLIKVKMKTSNMRKSVEKTSKIRKSGEETSKIRKSGEETSKIRKYGEETSKIRKSSEETSKMRKSGVDYRVGDSFSTVNGNRPQFNANLAIERCGTDCVKCVEGQWGLGMTKFTCEQKATTPRPTPPKTAKPIGTTSTTDENCVRTTRNGKRNFKAAKKLRKINRQRNKNIEPWGHWVGKGRQSIEGFYFCCTRGPRIGTMARTP